ncbi:MAG: ABC transporter ATP-binding protein [Erysipelotrichaceae bacterium]|nr:ABC transporter ATP-binding protein [Erysipelotrichaceae bacterium]
MMKWMELCMTLVEKLKERFKSENIRDFIQECLWVWKYIVRYKGTVMLHIVMGVVSIVMVLVSSVASKVLIDAVVGFNSGIIVSAAVWMLGMRLGSIGVKSISSHMSASVNIRVQNEIQSEIYRRILRTDWQSLERFRSGDLLHRISSDASTVAGGVTGFLPSLITCSVQFAGAFIIIMSSDPMMAVITLIGVPVTGLCSTFLLRKMRRYSREMKDVYSDVVSFQQESLQNITSIKSFGIMDWFGTQMDEVHHQYRHKYLQYSRFSVGASAFMSLLSLMAYICCFGWGVYRLWQGKISYGEMTMFLQLSSMLGTAFSSMIGLVPNAISITTSARRVMAVVELPEEKLEAEPGFKEEKSFTLMLDGVDFEYQGGAPVLKKADFEAKDGELVCLSGPSGEGKTTLLRIMLGLIEPTHGKAYLKGESGKVYPLSAATRQVFGYVPQGNQIFSGTIEENLRLAAFDASEEELIEALKAACAYDFVMALPEGIHHVVGGRDKRLSEGQAQRLAVARALLKKAPVLLLDEATSALDSETEEKMLENLMNSGLVHTCILVTHRPAAKKICSSSYLIRDGALTKEIF